MGTAQSGYPFVIYDPPKTAPAQIELIDTFVLFLLTANVFLYLVLVLADAGYEVTAVSLRCAILTTSILNSFVCFLRFIAHLISFIIILANKVSGKWGNTSRCDCTDSAIRKSSAQN